LWAVSWVSGAIASAFGGRGGRQPKLQLDCGRDGAGRSQTQTLQPAGGQAADGADPQNGQAGRQRIGHFVAQWHFAGGLDSTSRVAGSTRAAAAPNLPGEAAHAREESHSRNVISS